ncbi:hypothetical protein [Mucilaginibacter sp. UYCu711]|uniref:hypothetical protein n=1 Tax=Mucilaginibacter sp. UYCu711 TaxID=3156339 RepID=UPI003D20084C
MSNSTDSLPKEENITQQAADTRESYSPLREHIHLNITDDVDDEAVYGRHRHQRRGR